MAATFTLGMSSRGEDKSVALLERRIAELSDQEDAVFLPSVTAATLVAMLAMNVRGRRVILDDASHLSWMQGSHFAVFAGGVPVALPGGECGRMALPELERELDRQAYGRRIEPAVIALENTHNVSGGRILDPAYMADVSNLARAANVKLFVDGARIFDAAVAQNVRVGELTEDADAVVISMNKAIGAPYGAVLSGSHALVASAREEAERTGISQVHKAGMFAAAASVGLDGFEARIARTHELARQLAVGLADIEGIGVNLASVESNLVRTDVSGLAVDQTEFVKGLGARGIGVKEIVSGSVRYAIDSTHDEYTVDRAIRIVREYASLVGPRPVT